jgi:gliding motility-associated-like protein
LNDCFGISKWGQSIDLIVFNIYNRWGQIVFSGDFNRRCWDGKFKGLEQPSGNYVYKLKANTICGLVELKGDFMLIR